MATNPQEQASPCVAHSELYLNPLLDETIPTTTAANRRELALLKSRAERLCESCPLQARCLTDAVTKYDVSGFVAGTTRRQRQEIRARLGIKLAADDFDSYVGVSSGRQFDHDEIVRMRKANPTEPLSAIAARVGCSISTVKRHLRRIEKESETPKPSSKPAPTPDQVMKIARSLRRSAGRSAA